MARHHLRHRHRPRTRWDHDKLCEFDGGVPHDVGKSLSTTPSCANPAALPTNGADESPPGTRRAHERCPPSRPDPYASPPRAVRWQAIPSTQGEEIPSASIAVADYLRRHTSKRPTAKVGGSRRRRLEKGSGTSSIRLVDAMIQPTAPLRRRDPQYAGTTSASCPLSTYVPAEGGGVEFNAASATAGAPANERRLFRRCCVRVSPRTPATSPPPPRPSAGLLTRALRR